MTSPLSPVARLIEAAHRVASHADEGEKIMCWLQRFKSVRISNGLGHSLVNLFQALAALPAEPASEQEVEDLAIYLAGTYSGERAVFPERNIPGEYLEWMVQWQTVARALLAAYPFLRAPKEKNNRGI